MFYWLAVGLAVFWWVCASLMGVLTYRIWKKEYRTRKKGGPNV